MKYIILKGKIYDIVHSLICQHWWCSNLIFATPPQTHHVIESCIKCGKAKTVFKGTQTEWRSRHTLH